MFSGIVEEIGTVARARPGHLAVQARQVLEGTRLGDSLNVNGACLTVSALAPGGFSVDIMEETARRTSLGALRPGTKVNLERAVKAEGRLGGHLVQGHVDATGTALSVTPRARSRLLRLAGPPEVMRYVVEKGFIAVDGVSLTVVGRDARSFTVSLVGFTLEHTTLGQRRPGDRVSLEADIMAKYVEQYTNPQKGLTYDFLAQHGFTASR